MEKKKIRRLIITCLLAALVLGSVPAALAAITDYASTFPRYQDHVTIVKGTKTYTSSTSVTNRITGPSRETCGFFWVDLIPGSNQVTPTSYCDYGNNFFNYNEGLAISGTVYLRGQAATWDINTHEVTGTVNFG